MIYVDQLCNYNGRHWCHMTADGEDELHRFALALGIQRRWYQNKGYKWHYDLDPIRRQLAVQRGAAEINSRQMVRLMQERRSHEAAPASR